MNKLHERQVIEARKAVMEAADNLSSGTVPFIEGVRRLVALSVDVSEVERDSDFELFIAIASESDHLPPHEVRSQCTQTWLERCDGE